MKILIIGDREHDIEKLAGRAWDAVIDTCGYVPHIVRLSDAGAPALSNLRVECNLAIAHRHAF